MALTVICGLRLDKETSASDFGRYDRSVLVSVAF
jgi:hypothetical protein